VGYRRVIESAFSCQQVIEAILIESVDADEVTCNRVRAMLDSIGIELGELRAEIPVANLLAGRGIAPLPAQEAA